LEGRSTQKPTGKCDRTAGKDARRGSQAAVAEAKEMIRCYVTEDRIGPDGAFTLVIMGHGGEKACAGVSAIWHTALAGLALVAKDVPTEVAFQRQSFSRAKTKKKQPAKKPRR
jgi:hypothetical protein